MNFLAPVIANAVKQSLRYKRLLRMKNLRRDWKYFFSKIINTPILTYQLNYF
jgi:hypothetical protein